MKDTPTILAQLGESLAGAFYDRLLGLGLPEDAAFELPAADLSALFSLGGDIYHWQNVEMDWEQMEAQFTRGFVPENLITPVESGNDEQQNTQDTHAGTPLRQPRMQNFPFVSDSTNRAFAESKPANTRFGAPPAERIPETQQPLQAGQEPLTGTTSAQTNKPFEGAFHPDGIPSPLYNGPSVTPRSPNFQEPAETRIDGPVERANPESPPPQPINLDKRPNDPAAFHPEPAPSIWSQPLQGLGDFVSHYEPSTEPVPEKKFTAGQNPPPTRAAETPPVEDSRRFLMPLAVEDLLPGSATVQPEPMPPQQKAIFGKTVDVPENQVFKSIENNPDPTTALPDTDDILDELTQRIIRDFRRFYP